MSAQSREGALQRPLFKIAYAACTQAARSAGHDYADARSKDTTVTLLATESSGALSHCAVRLIRRLAAHVNIPEGHDAPKHDATTYHLRVFG